MIIPEKIGDAFCKALERDDYAEAIHVCAAYFRKKARNTLPELSARGRYSLKDAENCIKGISRSVNIDWEFSNGEIDFLFDPTAINGPVNHEWLWQFNRHNQWSNMARAYAATGDERYAAAFSRQLLKWIAQTDIPEKWNNPGSAWRTIECGLRLLGSWQITFDGFKSSPNVPDAVLLLMIASMHRQSTHLIQHPTSKNWLMMEANGIFTFSSLFTELSDSCGNREIAAKRLLSELEKQILPDGMHDELSPDYQSVVFDCAANFYSVAAAHGTAHEIPEEFVRLSESTVHAAVLLSTPAFTQPRTNDCYTIHTSKFTKRAEALFEHREENEFVNSLRTRGAPPRGNTASAFLPYAGLVAMRSDWGADATYMCFDVGPLGMAHVHNDKLNINIYKGSQELIYDDGGGQYEISPAREYACSGYGHNTVLVDGLAQYRRSPARSDGPVDASWITTPAFDYAAAVYDDTFGKQLIKCAAHRREVCFCKPNFFVVSDTLTSVDGNAHDYELLFHLDTTEVTQLPQFKNAFISNYGKDYEIAIIPIGEDEARVEAKAVSAITEPIMRGWYNGRNENCLHKAITVSRSAKGVKDFRFHTLLIPIRSGDAAPSITKTADNVFEVALNGKAYSLDLSALYKDPQQSKT